MQPPIASHPFYGKIVDAIISASESLGYSVFVTTDHEMSLRSADYMLEKRVDGLILISSLRQNVIDHIQKFGVPYLMVNGSTNDDNVIHIVNRDETGGKLAAEYLYSRGHRKICVIAGPQEHRSHYLRLKGFRSFLHDRGLSLEEAHILQSPTSAFESGYKILTECVDQILASDRTAIFATNDTLALGAMKVLL
jgi:DNA-binding LacI/PurR family transcriptional regulator